MRTVLAIASLTALLAGRPVAAASAAAPVATRPAANVAFLCQAEALVGRPRGRATGTLDTAKKSAEPPFAGEA